MMAEHALRWCYPGPCCLSLSHSLESVFPPACYCCLVSKRDYLSKFAFILLLKIVTGKKKKKVVFFIFQVLRDQNCALPPGHVIPEQTL